LEKTATGPGERISFFERKKNFFGLSGVALLLASLHATLERLSLLLPSAGPST